jgi:hypothetical protein
MPQSYHGASFGRQVDATGPSGGLRIGAFGHQGDIPDRLCSTVRPAYQASQTGVEACGGASTQMCRRKVSRQHLHTRLHCARRTTAPRRQTVPYSLLHLHLHLHFTISPSCPHHLATQRRQRHDSTPTKSSGPRCFDSRIHQPLQARFSRRRGRQAIQRPPTLQIAPA